jgi:hypothetical protein
MPLSLLRRALLLALALTACGRDEATGRADSPPAPEPCTPDTCVPETLTEGLYMPAAIEVDDSNVYYCDETSVIALPLAGGASTSLVSGQGLPTSLALEDARLYWTNFTEGTVRSVPVAGGTSTVLASGQSYPQFVAVAGGRVYWVNAPGYPDSVSVVPRDGGDPVVLYSTSNGISSIAADASGAYFTVGGDSGSPDGGALMHASASSDELVTLTDGQVSPRDVTVRDEQLYWVTGEQLSEQTILTMPATGGTPTALVTAVGITALAVDRSVVYFATASTSADANGELSRVPLAGGEPSVLVDGVTLVSSIALDDDFVYWADTGPLLEQFAGNVMRVRKSNP